MSDIHLTEEQAAVIKNCGGSLLVSAAAGSGKTKVLVERLIQKITDTASPVDINHFLIITFTHSAALELRQKIRTRLTELAAAYPENRRYVSQLQLLDLTQISTVHSFCACLLREFSGNLSIPSDFKVAEDYETTDIKNQVLLNTVNIFAEKRKEEFSTYCDYVVGSSGYRGIASVMEAVFRLYVNRPDPDKWLTAVLDSINTPTDNFNFLNLQWFLDLKNHILNIVDDFEICLQNLIKEIGDNEDLDGSYRKVLYANISEIDALRFCADWDAFHNFGNLKLTALSRKKSQIDPELKEQVKKIRAFYKKKIESALTPFRFNQETVLCQLKETAPYIELTVSIFQAYFHSFQEEKRKRGLLDYNDLEHGALSLLYGKKYPVRSSLAKMISSRYCEIMVDEYQDTSLIQEAIIHAIATYGNYSDTPLNLFFVGDLKQSIYGFRAAEPELFLSKYNNWKLYNDARNEEPRKILLNKNFRSDIEIIDAVNLVFSKTMTPRVGGLFYGEEEALHSGTQQHSPADTPVELYLFSADSKYDNTDLKLIEAKYVAQLIRDMLQNGSIMSDHGILRPVKPGDIAILLRSPRSNSEYFHDELSAFGIPSLCDRSNDFFQEDEIQILLSFLEVISNPTRDIPLAAVLTSPLFCFTSDDLIRIRQLPGKTMYDRMQLYSSDKAKEFIHLYHRLNTCASINGITEMFEQMLEMTNAIPIFAAMEAGESRIDHIAFLKELIYRHQNDGGNLNSLLEYLRKYRKYGKFSKDSGKTDAVTITSVHKAKGLEYPVVILSDLASAFNTQDSKLKFQVHNKYGICCDSVDRNQKIYYSSAQKSAVSYLERHDMLSEELRILYVAMTRAKNRLIMTYTDQRLENKLQELSAIAEYSPQFASSYANCPGDWILLAALSLPGVFNGTDLISPAHCPWKIVVNPAYTAYHKNAEDSSITASLNLPFLSQTDAEQILKRLDYQYPYSNSLSLPSRVSATQLNSGKKNNGRKITLPEIEFLDDGKADSMTPAEAGTALHHVMQYIDYSAIRNLDDVPAELNRLQLMEYITPLEADSVSQEQIFSFFSSKIGYRVQHADKVLREFHFSVIVPSNKYFPGTDEPLMLQGIADCCLIEGNSFSIIDFKTDKLSNSSAKRKAEYYRLQLDIYGEALSEVLQLPCKEKLIWFFSSGEGIKI